MSLWTDFGKGVRAHIDGISFIAKHRLWGYFMYPVFLVALLNMAGFWSVYSLSDMIVTKALACLTPELSTDAGWINMLLHLLLKLFGFVASFVLHIYLMTFFIKIVRYIVLILCSPMMALLSERVDVIITGKVYPFSFVQFMKDVMRGIGVNLRNLLLELLIIAGFAIIGWIPLIGWLTIPFLAIVSWYFLGFNMMDYTNERRRMSISQGAAFIRRRKGLAIGNGMIFALLLNIPYAGIIIAPVLSSVAGTLAAVNALKEEEQFAGK